MNKKKRILLLSIIGTLLIAALAVGTSYALWKVTKVQPGEANKLSTTCLNLTLENVSAEITLDTQFPITDEEGRKTTGYKFRVTNTCETYVTYDINLESIIKDTVPESSRMNLNYLDAIIDNGKTKQIGSYETTTSSLKTNEGVSYDTRKLKTDTIKPGSTETPTSKEYTLRVWMDESVEGKDAMDKTWIGKISIKGWPVSEMPLYADASGAEAPDLDNGLIPVTYDTETSKWVKADTSTKWYDYDEQWWANAVTVSASSRATYTSAAANTPISMDDIETMWVWIPRYEYQHSNLGTTYAGGSRANPGAITINFISKGAITPSSDNFTIHDAFWWDNNNNGTKDTGEQLSGIWVAKFEMSTGNTTCTAESGCDFVTINPHIKPSVTSWRGARIGTSWTAIHNNMNGTSNQYGLTNSDAHLMKNMEWGAVAYLSQSKYGKYGNTNYTGADKEVAINNCSTYITGIGGDSVSAGSSSTTCTTNTYETKKGKAASTTGNIYGIYDMSGGADEYVMGIEKELYDTEPAVGYSSDSNSGWSGKLYDGTAYTGTYERLGDDPSTKDIIEGIGIKYYDLYNWQSNYSSYAGYHKGDATKEVANWYSDQAYFVNQGAIFFERGGISSFGTSAGIFRFGASGTGISNSTSSRPVLVHAS